MTDDQQREFGRRVKEFRKRAGLDQQGLAGRLGKSASWVSQVERGAIPVKRLDALRALADQLGVALHQLEPSLPAAAPEELPSPSATNDLDGARLLISGHPALDVLLPGRGSEQDSAPSTADLARRVETVWDLAHQSAFVELTTNLQTLVPALERAARVATGDDRVTVLRLLARTYQALAAAFVRQDEADAAWIAADRAIRAAEASGQPLEVCAAIYRLVHAFVRLKHLDQAEYAARTAVQTLRDHIADRSPTPEEHSVLGSLHLVLALVHARAGRRSAAKAELDEARGVARELGADRNDFNLEFGPTNVEIQAVATAVDLGDAGEAIDIGESLNTEGLSAERQARLLMDLGRAYVQRRQAGEALDCLLRAEGLAPELLRTHVAARSAIRELVLLAGTAAPEELRALAERADAQDS
ncbi:helix-turn-helix domain-containing protein [Streptomyces actinomycinicus]|uniref:Helix-turn-helix domain-containing protein n=1 Tax=Streptomyces actinomycinicus TaxID=1695166 RepID=A0A937ERC9_9ACTN|nr:helix-turn-helix transcriptional regulator [Streptomyces actinomycinicus]MBL1086791.1 helix-turn-helix domain-containing protein [Streptomyces actinomycinicus]